MSNQTNEAVVPSAPESMLIGRIKRWPIGAKAAAWSLNILLPVAPTLSESLRIAGQDWDGDVVEFYVADAPKQGPGITLHLTRGKPVLLDGLTDLQFVVHTDADHRFHWRVTELSSGSAVTKALPTEGEAIASALRNIKRYGSDGVMRALLEARERFVGAYQKSEAPPRQLTPVDRSTAAILQGLGVDVKPGDLMQRG